ncbi:MAG: hypothetical protein B7Y25_08400 [Alphaproteobacteria bacterium 16-39-46]|nr:MAG: hypothetical protein B7Y25_08400 [Alphaproteobacteria bacterium 16-39-46]OZA41076.1 MAG: hypothetical protein B7X84_08610 [Alphaproteobacteria bacterium 17-39-52]HQS84902.1 LptA/OstA family protein [Alphaproteobacteria bacterium]HQS94669.1 LptA/OstA family protein [Alphaproteobacteria bacterium]
MSKKWGAKMQVFRKFCQFLRLILVCFLGSVSQKGWANDSDTVPIHIEADQMNYDMKKDTAEAIGSAWATQGDKKIEADRFVVKFQEKKSSSPSLEKASKDVEEIIALGHVRLISPSEEITGASAVYNLRTEIITVFGEKIVLVSSKGSVEAHKSLSYDQKNQKVVALGHVIVVSESYEMRAPKISVDFKKIAPSQNQKFQESLTLNSMEAEGGVILKTQSYISESDRANYLAETGMVDLVGNVKITDGKNIFEGPCGEYNEKTGKSRLVTCLSKKSQKEGEVISKGRVKALLYATKKKVS